MCSSLLSDTSPLVEHLNPKKRSYKNTLCHLLGLFYDSELFCWISTLALQIVLIGLQIWWINYTNYQITTLALVDLMIMAVIILNCWNTYLYQNIDEKVVFIPAILAIIVALTSFIIYH